MKPHYKWTPDGHKFLGYRIPNVKGKYSGWLYTPVRFVSK